ncbi:MAG: ROK family protein [Lautropia sp.]
MPTDAPRPAPRLIGVDLGGTKTEVAVLDADGRFLLRERAPTPKGDYDATLASIAALVGRTTGLAPPQAPVGVAIPGAISPASGLVKNANSTWLNGRAFAADLARTLGRAVRMQNDANCLAVSEAVDGAGAGAKSVFAAILGTGVGAGIAIDAAVLAGANAIAGEWGHNPLPRPAPHETPGPRCWCGRDGCLETWLSGPAIAADHRAPVAGGAATAEAIAAQARAGDPAAVATIDRFVGRLARALAGVVNLLDPDVIVLGGGVSNIAEIYRRVPPLLGAHVFSDRIDTRLVPAAHGDSSGVRGAAWLWRA